MRRSTDRGKLNWYAVAAIGYFVVVGAFTGLALRMLWRLAHV